jgi:hypothetical protein
MDESIIKENLRMPWLRWRTHFFKLESEIEQYYTGNPNRKKTDTYISRMSKIKQLDTFFEITEDEGISL